MTEEITTQEREAQEAAHAEISKEMIEMMVDAKTHGMLIHTNVLDATLPPEKLKDGMIAQVIPMHGPDRCAMIDPINLIADARREAAAAQDRVDHLYKTMEDNGIEIETIDIRPGCKKIVNHTAGTSALVYASS